MKRHAQLKLDDRIKIQVYLEDEIPISVILAKIKRFKTNDI